MLDPSGVRNLLALKQRAFCLFYTFVPVPGTLCTNISYMGDADSAWLRPPPTQLRPACPSCIMGCSGCCCCCCGGVVRVVLLATTKLMQLSLAVCIACLFYLCDFEFERALLGLLALVLGAMGRQHHATTRNKEKNIVKKK